MVAGRERRSSAVGSLEGGHTDGVPERLAKPEREARRGEPSGKTA
jgi:hypothetical protein